MNQAENYISAMAEVSRVQAIASTAKKELLALPKEELCTLFTVLHEHGFGVDDTDAISYAWEKVHHKSWMD